MPAFSNLSKFPLRLRPPAWNREQSLRAKVGNEPKSAILSMREIPGDAPF